MTGGMMIYSVPDGAEIYIDGNPAIYPYGGIIRTPVMINDIPVGMHYVTFKLPGYIEETKVAEVIEGQWADVDAILHQELPKLLLGEIDMLQPKQLGTVVFDSSPRNAKIYVDGQVLVNPDTGEDLRTPARALLYEGRHDYTFVLENHEDVSGYVDVLVGTTVNIFGNLKPGKSEEGWGQPQPQIWLQQPQQAGILKVYSFPDGASVSIDGKYVGSTPIVVTDIPAGARRVTFTMPGMMVEEKIVDIHPGAWSEVDATMRPVLPKFP